MCSRMVLYLSLEDWADCYRCHFPVSEWSHEQHHHHHRVVCSLGSWGRDARVARGMMKRTQQARSRFGDSSLQWQQVVLLSSTSASRSLKRKQKR